MVTVRLAAPGEAAILHAIAREAYQHYVPRIGREPAPMSADYGAAVRDGQAWVAVDQLAYYPRRGSSETHRAEQDGFR